MEHNAYEEWNAYVARERALLEPVLAARGYRLEERQPHVSGERFLMQALTTASGKKLILLGTDTTGARVVIKATRDAAGARELTHERSCRTAIHTLPFAYHAFASPKELFFGNDQGFCISIQEFIDQEISFLKRPTSEQFTYALQAFKAQEGSHAATYEQLRLAQLVFDHTDAAGYLSTAQRFRDQAVSHGKSELVSLYERALAELERKSLAIAQYGNFLTHTDFVPHNFRIADGKLYLLDYSSIRFGNKHEGWARFLNFMTLHNPELEDAFLKYYADNRSVKEGESLRAMRIYRLTEIITYYLRTVPRSTGNLNELNRARVSFWAAALQAQLEGSALSAETRDSYVKTRDSLRSEDERARQQDLH